MKFNFKKIIGVVLTGATLAFSLVAGTGCSGGDVGKWFEDQYKQLTCEHKTEAIVDAVPATCTEAGLTAGIKCGDCGKMIVKQDKVPALGHTLTHFDEVEPSCLVSGLTAGDYCGVCETWVVKQERVKATGHKVVTLEAKAATCTETGLTEGQGCENCGEIYKAQEIIAAKGHTFNDNHVCTTCSACDHSVKDYVCEYCNSYVGLEKTTLEDELEVGATYLVKVQGEVIDGTGSDQVNVYEVGGALLGVFTYNIGLTELDDRVKDEFGYVSDCRLCFEYDDEQRVNIGIEYLKLGDDYYCEMTILHNTVGLYDYTDSDKGILLSTYKYNFGTEAFKVIEE